MPQITLTSRDALILVDVQEDFLEGGGLPVPGGRQIIPILNAYITCFTRAQLPIFATRDWHPPRHCSFKDQGGPWPVHCVQHTHGAAFAHDLELPESAIVIAKGTAPDRDAYSGFQGTDLHRRLQTLGLERLFIGGLALDVCVLQTALDAARHGYHVCLLEDAACAVNLKPGDGAQAFVTMHSAGVASVTLAHLQ
jgi:nicotinamidase/pyrazinamidase